MKLISSALALAIGASVLAGCASTDPAPGDASADKSPRVYRTGSNIPVKDTSAPMTEAEREKMRQDVANQSAVAGQRSAGSK